MGRMAIFIDGAYLQNILRYEFTKCRLAWDKFALKVAGDREILRTYYYDCLPYQSSPPTEEEKDRFSKKQKFLHALGEHSRFQVRLGRLEYRGRDSNSRPIFQQKRVDILLGVDLALLAAKHQITDAAIVAGDSDFMPAIEAAKPEGVVIHLFHGQTVHRDLVQTCDECNRIDQEFINSITLV